MNKMLEKNVIGWNEGDYSVLTLQSFYISQVLPAGKLIRDCFGDSISSKESAICWYADFVQSSLYYILAKTSPIVFYPVCSELRPMQLSVNELLQDFATGLSGFAKEIDSFNSRKSNSELKKYSSAIKDFVKIIPSIKL